MERAAIMDNPAPDSDASVKSLGIFLQTVEVFVKQISAVMRISLIYM